jgi:hypothetical protein
MRNFGTNSELSSGWKENHGKLGRFRGTSGVNYNHIGELSPHLTGNTLRLHYRAPLNVKTDGT